MRILIFILVLVSPNLMAQAYVASGTTDITYIGSYNQYGGGDVQFRLSDPHQDCEDGYWLTKSDPGFEANFSMLLAAYQAKTKVRIFGLPSERWAGSSREFCKVYSVEYR